MVKIRKPFIADRDDETMEPTMNLLLNHGVRFWRCRNASRAEPGPMVSAYGQNRPFAFSVSSVAAYTHLRIIRAALIVSIVFLHPAVDERLGRHRRSEWQ